MQSRVRRATIGIVVPILAVAAALGTVALLLVMAGSNPLPAYQSMIDAAFGTLFSLSATINKSLPRLLAGLGIALALRARLWNIGAEGQIYIGAVGASAVALFAPALPFPVIPILAFTAAALAGAVWGAIPGILRATRGISEVITSLMLVYVAIQITNYLVEGPWLTKGQTFPSTDRFAPYAVLPNVLPGTLANAGLIVALGAVVVAGLLMDRSTFGLYLRAVGGNEKASRFTGLPVSRIIVSAMALSGAFAGLAGAVEVLGARGRLLESFSPGYGFDAIAVALLGRLHPLGVVGAALLFGALDAGGAGLQTTARGVPSAIVPIVEGLAVVYVLIGLAIVEILERRARAQAALRQAEREARSARQSERLPGRTDP